MKMHIDRARTTNRALFSQWTAGGVDVDTQIPINQHPTVCFDVIDFIVIGRLSTTVLLLVFGDQNVAHAYVAMKNISVEVSAVVGYERTMIDRY